MVPMSATPPPAMSCFIPWDFAPGLSLPYPSIRFTTPQIPRPAPSAITRVCRTPTALLKNAIREVTKIADLLFFVDLLFSDKTQKKNKPFFVGLLYCDFGFSFLCFSW